MLLPLMIPLLERSSFVVILTVNYVPSPSSSIPAPLTVQPSLVLLTLRSFQRGTSPGSSALRPQHLLDAVCGFTAPAAVECLHFLTHCINGLLAGTLDSRLAPWFCGAPLTALVKKGVVSGLLLSVRPFVVW